MITKENKTDKLCSFYASDFHLEMIMLPYINRKLEEKAKIIIITEKNLKETIKVVISKLNLAEERKKEILDIDWGNKSFKNIKCENKESELIFFVIGNKNYIEETNKYINNLDVKSKLKVINCYELEEVQNQMPEIVSKHSKVLNTMGEKEL